ncbi:hypothetical protein K1719_005106 [Acacia pycnantha]|nr:hypothetical protein K1719_005106 [Acacia pycnantha]
MGVWDHSLSNVTNGPTNRDDIFLSNPPLMDFYVFNPRQESDALAACRYTIQRFKIYPLPSWRLFNKEIRPRCCG